MVKGAPVLPMTAAPAFRLRSASGMSAVTTISPGPARSAIQLSAASKLSLTHHQLDAADRADAQVGVADDVDLQAVALGNAIDLILDRDRRRHRRRWRSSCGDNSGQTGRIVHQNEAPAALRTAGAFMALSLPTLAGLRRR